MKPYMTKLLVNCVHHGGQETTTGLVSPYVLKTLFYFESRSQGYFARSHGCKHDQQTEQGHGTGENLARGQESQPGTVCSLVIFPSQPPKEGRRLG
jgi:hypothetical protein